jgi:hypothetical protein
MANKKSQKSPNIFVCKNCDYNTISKKDYNKHILTDKHIRLTSEDIKNPINGCICGKKYVFKSSLSKHKQRCKILTNKKDEINENDENSVPKLTPELLIEIIKQNKELQQALIDQNKELQQTVIQQNKQILDLTEKTNSYYTTNNTINTINTNCGNNTFNLQLFLNETCKDAINMSDFVNQLQISLTDLEETGQIGYAEGISKVFIKNLNDINYTNRPLHCSDSKRETLYIKEDNKWTKDDEQKSGLTKAIKQVANKNIKQIIEWQKLHPDFSDPESKTNDKYMQIVLNSMSGSTKEEADKNYEKIAKKVIKEVVIDKLTNNYRR